MIVDVGVVICQASLGISETAISVTCMSNRRV